MDDQTKKSMQVLINHMRESADAINSFDLKGNVEKLINAAMDLRQGANTIEDLLKMIDQLEDNPGLD